MQNLLIKALAKVIAAVPQSPELKTSGNIKSRIDEYAEDQLIKVSDAYFTKTDRRQDAFARGVDYGKVAKQKPGYLIELPKAFVAFIGSEADIIRRIDEYEASLVTDATDGA